MTAEEAAALIKNEDVIGFSGFTPAGACKVIPKAIAKKAMAEHEAGRPFKVGVVTGASTGPSLDGALAKANAVLFRTPYQSNADLRKQINSGETRFFDMHLSLLPQYVRYGFLGKFNWAIVEACDVNDNGEITLSTSVGASPTFCDVADKIIVELNTYHPKALRGFHDIYMPVNPPHRREIPIYKADDRIGTEVIKVDPSKIVGYVVNHQPDEVAEFKDSNPITEKIGENTARFLAGEIAAGRIPREFLPIQSGVGNIANAVLGALGANPEIPQFSLYSEVIQDSVIDLMDAGRIRFASGTSLTVTKDVMDRLYKDLSGYRSKILLRPQEISNSPELVRRLGIISINTALELDIFGNVNSTHVLGKNMMNGIGGSGDFTRNAYISIFTCPSVAKGGKISAIVPLCSHMDHSEHSVQVIITEQGIADLRGKGPIERARLIIENCANPEYREELRDYLKASKDGHTPQTLKYSFAMHEKFLETGDMRGVKWDI
ncbi:MAG: Propionyl-CoA:succinate CoA transferase [Verrucomicrobia bacterium ADurb.Bin474]|nr:MAG: Propionyl-CoA:succinate CoA transferase [Verrucomicrobia bacterium ADurb.Bin474]